MRISDHLRREFLCVCLFWLLAASPLSAAPPRAAEQYPSPEMVKAEAEQGFIDILSLWRDRHYEQLYNRVIPDSRYTRDNFVELMEYTSRRPACCWEQLQELTARYTDERHVTITARLGLEAEGIGTRFVTSSFYLVKEEGVWKLPARDIITLSEPNWQRIPNRWPVRSPNPY